RRALRDAQGDPRRLRRPGAGAGRYRPRHREGRDARGHRGAAVRGLSPRLGAPLTSQRGRPHDRGDARAGDRAPVVHRGDRGEVRKYLHVFSIGLQNVLQRRSSLIMDRVGGIAVMLTLYYFWSSLLAGKDSFAGYSRVQMLSYVLVMNLLR